MNTMAQAHKMTREFFKRVPSSKMSYRGILREMLVRCHDEFKRLVQVAVKLADGVLKRCPWLERDNVMNSAMTDCTRIAGQHGVAMLEKQFRNGI